MWNSVFLSLALLGASPYLSISPAEEDSKAKPTSATTLKIEGNPGVKLFGYCISVHGPNEKSSKTSFEAVSPTEVHFDAEVQECKVSAQDGGAREKKSPVTIRVFQNRQYLMSKELGANTSGIEFVIPLGSKNRGRP